MDNNYIIINKDVLEKRIKELEGYLELTKKEVEFHELIVVQTSFEKDTDWQNKYYELLENQHNQEGALVALQRLNEQNLSQSIPLIPQLQLAYLAGYDMAKGINKITCEKYVSQLKLDI